VNGDSDRQLYVVCLLVEFGAKPLRSTSVWQSKSVRRWFHAFIYFQANEQNIKI